MGFHKRNITKGIYGQLSKIREELEEAEDALEQKQTVMLLVELADIVGACGGVAQHFNVTLDDLVAFAALRSEVAVEEATSEVTS